MSSERDRDAVFGKEHELDHRIGRILAEPPDSIDELMAEYRLVAQAYGKLLRNAEKITRLADSGQKKLMKLMSELEKKNHEIAHQHSRLEEANRMLEEASLTDSLTGLRNRRFLANFLEKEIEGMERRLHEDDDRHNLLFLLLDIDHFKLINDTHGHPAGDRVLQQIARLISENCRKGDIPVRWGGEEFLMVCRDADTRYAPHLAERLRTEIEQTGFPVGRGRVLKCTASLGFATFPFFNQAPFVLSWEQVVDIADQGLYTAKNNGRNAWVGVTSRRPDEGADEGSLETSLTLESLERQGIVQIHSSLPEGVAFH